MNNDLNYLKQMEAASFNSFNGTPNNFENYDPSQSMYDPEGFDENNYDPENYEDYNGRGKRVRPLGAATRIVKSPMQSPKGAMASANFDLTIKSSFLTPFTAQIFAPLYCVAETQDLSINAAIPLMCGDASGGYYTGGLPYLGGTPAAPVAKGMIGGVVSLYGDYFICYFSSVGELIWEQKVGARIDQCIIQCAQIPYRSLLKWLMSGSFRINNMRNTYNQSTQINSEYKWFSKTWLGAQNWNTIQPRNYFSPDQFQSLIVDVRAGVSIDKQSGFTYIMQPNTTGTSWNQVDSNISVSLYSQGGL